MNTELLAMSHIVVKNPILREREDIKKQYLKLLRKYLRIGGWNRRKYVKAQMEVYEDLIEQVENTDKKMNNLAQYKHYIIFDLLHILGFEKKIICADKMLDVMDEIILDFPELVKEKNLIRQIFDAGTGDQEKWELLQKNDSLKKEVEYIRLIQKNLQFRSKKPFTLMVTATMSAGKSTFINALIGKYVNLSQNMACTSKIHSIIGKGFEDGYLYEYDHELVLEADKEELLNDNDLNSSNKIIVSAYCSGELGGKRVVINDSPGVNFSGDETHKDITNRLIRSKKYDVLIYLMNATQLGTNDDAEHLDFVKETLGRKPMIFIINKIDEINVEDEDVGMILKRQVEYIKSKGYKNPIICPISSRAAYLAKISKSEQLSKVERRELNNYIDKFDEMDLLSYYNEYFPDIRIKDGKTEEEQLLKTCGLAYVEKIINVISEGGKINGTGVRKI